MSVTYLQTIKFVYYGKPIIRYSCCACYYMGNRLSRVSCNGSYSYTPCNCYHISTTKGYQWCE